MAPGLRADFAYRAGFPAEFVPVSVVLCGDECLYSDIKARGRAMHIIHDLAVTVRESSVIELFLLRRKIMCESVWRGNVCAIV
jgi:hypothetical protein